MAVRYDPLSEEFRHDRAGVYGRLRDRAPAYLDPGGRFAALSRFEDDDPGLLPQAIEEMLRREPPTQTSARQTTHDVELHGVVIPADTRVLLVWGAANLDERAFDEPDTFDVHRVADRHLSLGHGAQFCMGAALARLEARVAFEELLACMPEFQVVDEPERIRSAWAWGFESLRLEFPAVER
jgi:cytochrome P450